ncbi:MAG: DUF3825 domain-containing protein [Thermotogota bacterium]
MKGTIKFVDVKTGLWGFIVPEDGSPDVHLDVSDFSGPRPGPADAGLPIEFDLDEADGKRHARSPRLLAAPSPPSARQEVPGKALTRWAFVPFVPFTNSEGRRYATVTELLASVALPERWHFGQDPDPEDPYPILKNYLTYTFHRLQREGKLVEYRSAQESWAAFNPGLVDSLYDRIFALFTQNRRQEPEWYFHDFCVPGKGKSGKQLTSVFDPLPKAATYFSNSFDMLLDTSRDIHVDYEHVIMDGIRRDRFPHAFVESHCPKGWQEEKYWEFAADKREAYLGKLASAIADDVQCLRGIKSRLEDAKGLAEKRTSWNFKTAIPQYYPRYDTMSLLLPLAIVNDEVVDVALVVTRNPSGSYQGRTVLPLAWAYMNARLVCRPDSDWLVPDRIEPEEFASEDDQARDAEVVGEEDTPAPPPALA